MLKNKNLRALSSIFLNFTTFETFLIYNWFGVFFISENI